MKINIVNLKYFTVFPEYFVSVSLLYIILVTVLITYKFYGLMIQKALSECMSLIMFMTCYLLLNDDLIEVQFHCINGSIANGYFVFFVKLTLCFFSGIYFLLISDVLKEQKLTSVEYLIITLFAVLGFMLMCSSNDLLTAYLSIELASLSSYLLASFKKTSTYSVEAGIKYFVTGSISSAFFLLGSSYLYGLAGSIRFDDFFNLFDVPLRFAYPRKFNIKPPVFENWITELLYYLELNALRTLIETNPFEPISFVSLGLTFILFSLFIKLGVAPFHLWSLDVYEGSPTTATFFFAVIGKLGIFVILLRIFYFGFADPWILENCQYYSMIFGLISIFVGSFGGLKQRKIKTLLAYSSTSHMGYCLLAFSAGNMFAVQIILFYIIIYMISGTIIWFILLSLRIKRKVLSNKHNKELGDLTLLSKSNPSLAFSFSLALFSLAGIPPLIGFLAKMGIFLLTISVSYYLVSLSAILFSVVSTFYYIRVVKIIYFENVLVGRLYYPISNSKAAILSIFTLLLIFLFINPNLLYLLTYKAAIGLFYAL